MQASNGKDQRDNAATDYEVDKAALKELVKDMDPKEVVDLMIGMQGKQYRAANVKRALYCLRYRKAAEEKRRQVRWNLGRLVGIGKSKVVGICKRCEAI